MDSALLDACGSGKLAEATELLDRGANPNAVDKNPARGFSALVCATEHPQIVSLLLKHGAKPEERDANGLRPILFASSSGSVESLGLLLNAGANPNATGGDEAPLSAGAGQGELESAKVLLEKGASINYRSSSTGFTALHSALVSPMGKPGSRLKMVEFLLAHGANTSIKDAKGRTALDWAEKYPLNRKEEFEGIIQTLRKATTKGQPSACSETNGNF